MISKLKKLISSPFKKIILSSCRQFFLTAQKIKRSFISPPIPKNQDGRVLIHLGGGEKNAPGWINIDLLKLPHIHFIQDATNLNNFRDNFADLIYASHVLEHINHRETAKALKEWRRVLKPDGLLRLSVPDFDKIINIYNSEGKNMEAIMEPLMGGQDYQFNFHRTMFNKEYLTRLFKISGFKEVRNWSPESAPYHAFHDWSGKSVSVNNRKYPVSLNLEAIK